MKSLVFSNPQEASNVIKTNIDKGFVFKCRNNIRIIFVVNYGGSTIS